MFLELSEQPKSPPERTRLFRLRLPSLRLARLGGLAVVRRALTSPAFIRRSISCCSFAEASMPKSPEMDGLLLAMGVGTALSAWAGFEVRLTHLFAVLSDMPDAAKACSSFDVIISFEVRLAICGQLMQWEDCDPLEKATWKRFKILAGKLHRKRHEVAHFSIVEKTEDGKNLSTCRHSCHRPSLWVVRPRYCQQRI